MVRGNELERLYRDVRCGGFHPANDALSHELIGKTLLGDRTRPAPLVIAAPTRARHPDASNAAVASSGGGRVVELEPDSNAAVEPIGAEPPDR